MPPRPLSPLLVAAAALLATPALAQPGAPADMVARLMEADTNHDGRITRDELYAYRAAQWQRMDRNGDGYFTPADLPAMLAGYWDSPRLTAMRAQFDTDHDGRLSHAEFVNGPSPGFDLADTNGDGIVTKDEIRAARATLAARGRGQ